MAIKHLTAPLLAGGVILGYAAWSRLKKSRTLPADRGAHLSLVPDDTEASLEHSPDDERILGESSLEQTPDRAGLPDGVPSASGFFTSEINTDGASSRMDTLEEPEPLSLDLTSLSSSPQRVPLDLTTLDFDSGFPSPASALGRDASLDSGASPEAEPLNRSSTVALGSSQAVSLGEPRTESSPIVNYSSGVDEELAREEVEQYEAEGAMAPEDIGVRWLARATEALSPYNSALSRSREMQEDWVEAGLVAEASVRAADGGELILSDDELDDLILDDSGIIEDSVDSSNRISHVDGYRR